MKHLLLTTIAAVVLVGCGPSVPDISIHVAVKSGNIEAVKQHLAAGTDVNAKSKGNGWTPLFYATSGGGQKEIAELLIAEGANVNAKDKLGDTSLQVAAYQGHKEIAELFIANGADVNSKADNGKTPLDWADGETADILRKHGGKHSTINTAATAGDAEAVKEFLATGAEVNAKDGWGWTPLHLAVDGGHTEIVELLIAKGADVNAKDDDGDTPLDWAIFNKQTETADLLRKHGGKTKKELKAAGK